ncbi:MFS transporter [Halogeometricum limi]|uniref:MFS transporter, PPP family, 3-phenylpropionic acid transporter n=1 Tax=Halogeometricum limi TaxID=555875 RepID=A0A1I6IBJ4_9EURY|nr:MFS transporter [Halogeometricum limi]SFR64041.1 MFS transporter, PPP family, 3-phenylpropionic acid transporter [Halogeometricum limi]
MRERRYFRAFYFLYFASWSGFVVFRNAHFESVGLSGVEMGTVGFLLRVAGIFALPGWGLLSDRFGARRRILLVGVAMSGVLGLLYPRVASAFPLLAAVTVAFAVFRAPIRPVANSMVLSTGLSYGSVRAYGSLAFGVAALGVGLVSSRVGSAVVFYAFAVGMAALAVILFRVPVRSRPPTESVGLRAASLVTNRNFAALLVAAFLMGAILPAGSAYLSVYVRSIGGTDAITGLSVAAKTAGEAVVFLSAVRFATTYRRLLVVGAGCHALTFGFYATSPTPTLVVAMQVLLGVGYAAFMLAAVNLAHELAPASLESTAQTFLTGFGLAAGSALGELASGRLVDLVGVQSMYAYATVVGLAVVAVSGLLDGSLGTGDSFPADG